MDMPIGIKRRFSGMRLVILIRACFVAIGGILAVEMALDAWQVAALRLTHDTIEQDAVPALRFTGTLALSTSELIARSREISQLSSEAEVDEARAAIADTAFRVADIASRLAEVGGHDGLAGALVKAAAEVKVAAEGALEAQIGRIEANSRAQAVLTDARRVEAHLDHLAAPVRTRSRRLIQETVPDPDVRDGAARSLYQVEVARKDVAWRVVNLTMIARTLEQPQNALGLARTGALVSTQLNGAAIALGSAGDFPERRTLARELIAFHELMFDRDGVLDTLGALQEQELRAEVAFEKLALSIAELSVATQALARDRVTTIVAASDELARLTRRLTSSEFVGNLLLVGAVIFLVVLVIERRVIGRLTPLARTTETLAAGTLDVPISLSRPDEIGAMERALVTFRDNARELQRSNEELARFAYVASHDLRSPLRAIQNLAEWTLDDEADTLSENGRRNLDLMVARSRRLSRMLTELLDYAAVGKADRTVGVLDLDQLAVELKDMLAPDRDFVIQNDGLASVTVNRTPVRTAILNLVSNAIKHHDGEAGRVTITARETVEALEIDVADDGPGIPQAYHAQVFELFRTLRPRDEVEGSGFGLALVRKIATTLEGEVHLISDPTSARGTTARLVLPRLDR